MNRLAGLIDEVAAGAVDHHEFFEHTNQAVEAEIGYEIASWASMDPATLLFTSCDVFVDGIPLPHDTDREQAIMEAEFAGSDPMTYLDLVRSERRVASLRAEVEDVSSVERYKRVIAPMGGHDEMRLILRDRTGVWGAVAMGRADAEFDDDARDLAASLSSVLATGLRHVFLSVASHSRTSVPDPPGALTLHEDGSLASTSEPAERWLDTLTSGQVAGIIATLTRQVAIKPLVRLTASGSQGHVTFHGYPRKGPGDQIAVIVERARDAELADVIMRAHGLTAREAEVTRWVLNGNTNRQVATGLGIAEYTVQDHLKSIYGKFGVATRSELQVAVYARHYAPRRRRDARPGPYGWFLEA